MSKFNSLNKAKTDEDLKELIDEHKQLVKVLKSPSHKDDEEETEKQEGELKEYEERLENFKKAWKDMISGIGKPEIEKAVLTHQLQRDYDHIADVVKNFPPKDTLGVLSLPNTAKVIDIDKIWSNLMNPNENIVKGGEGSGRKKVINLTTKEKSEKHFNNLEEERRKQAVKNYSKEQVDSAYDDLLQRESVKKKMI
jgi:hypothetical protein